MKKFAELMEEIKAECEKLKATEEEYNKVLNDWHILTFDERKAQGRNDYDTKVCELSESIKNMKLSIKILRNNARLALYNEVLPVALAVLEKYNGKPYGEKTRQKICNEVKEKTGCSFYIGKSDEINIYTSYGYDYNLEATTKYINGNQKKILIDNKIQSVTMEDFQLWNINKHTENVTETVNKIKELHKLAMEKKAELEAILSQFNALSVNGIEHMYANWHFNVL